MYLAPAAAWTVGHARWPRRFLAGTSLLGLSLCSWLAFRQPWGASSAFLLILPGVCLVLGVWGLHRSPQGQLRWDGERWHWMDRADEAPAAVVTDMACVLDLQRVLLLRVACGPAVHWLWLESGAMDGRWMALRRAVVAAPRSLRPRPDDALLW